MGVWGTIVTMVGVGVGVSEVPGPGATGVGIGATAIFLKLAVTLWPESIKTEQLPVPEQSPEKPENS